MLFHRMFSCKETCREESAVFVFLLTGTADVAPCGILNAPWFAFRVGWTALNQTVTDNISYLYNCDVKSDLCCWLAKKLIYFAMNDCYDNLNKSEESD